VVHTWAHGRSSNGHELRIDSWFRDSSEQSRQEAPRSSGFGNNHNFGDGSGGADVGGDDRVHGFLEVLVVGERGEVEDDDRWRANKGCLCCIGGRGNMVG
jgi:hypothetical protein